MKAKQNVKLIFSKEPIQVRKPFKNKLTGNNKPFKNFPNIVHVLYARSVSHNQSTNDLFVLQWKKIKMIQNRLYCSLID